MLCITQFRSIIFNQQNHFRVIASCRTRWYSVMLKKYPNSNITEVWPCKFRYTQGYRTCHRYSCEILIQWVVVGDKTFFVELIKVFLSIALAICVITGTKKIVIIINHIYVVWYATWFFHIQLIKYELTGKNYRQAHTNGSHIFLQIWFNSISIIGNIHWMAANTHSAPEPVNTAVVNHIYNAVNMTTL